LSGRIESQQPQDEGLETVGLNQPAPKPKKTLDPGAKKNLLIIGGAVGAAVLVMGGMFMMGGDPAVPEGNLPGTVIDPGIGVGAQREQVQALSPEEMARLDRVIGREADAAAEQGRTFVPADIPIVRGDQPMQPVQPMMPPMPMPPGINYNLGTGAHTQGPSPQEQERMERVMQGFQAQLLRISEANTVPPTSSAPRYGSGGPGAQGNVAANGAGAGAGAAGGATAGTAGAPVQQAALVGALSISAAELLTTINTERTTFVSARIVAGPAAGATLYGTSEMVSDQGVRVTFSRMLLDGRSHNISAIALDPADSHDLLNANVDRKEFERYVLPVLGAMGSAYFTARGQQAQRVVTGPGSDVIAVDQDRPTSREAVAQALAAGMAATVEQIAAQPAQPSATLPAGSSIGILFMEPVLAAAPASAAPAMRANSWR